MAEPTPRVSIVMPVFNSRDYVGEAVESLLKQTLTDFELLAVDDGSDDGSAMILEDLRDTDARVRPIAIGHQGVVAALNLGWREARADYVAIAHADDVSLPERLSRQVEYLDKHGRVAVVGSLVETIDQFGNPGRVLRFPAEAAAVRATLRRHNCLAHPSVMFRRSAIASVGGYRIDYVEDYDLWLRISERFDVTNLQEVLVRYRIHPGQISLSRIEEMERLQLAVKAASRERSAGRPDPIEGVHEVTESVLERLNVRERDVARASRREWLARAAILAELDTAQARDLVAEGSEVVGARAMQSLRAARQLLCAESCLAEGQLRRALAHVARAFFDAPLYTFARVAYSIGERVRGVL